MFGQSEGDCAADEPVQAMRHIPRLLLASLALTASCASSGDPAALEDSNYGPVQIRFHDYRGTQQTLTIRNETSIDRVEYYSSGQGDLGTKVASDEIVNVLMETFEAEDFWEYARPGKPPMIVRPSEGGYELMAHFYVKTGEREGWSTIRKGLGEGETDAFRTCTNAFVAVYNEIAAFQLLDEPVDDGFFQQPPAPR